MRIFTWFLLLFYFKTYGQTKNDLWLRTTVDYTFKNPKFKIDNELQYRLQDNHLQEFIPEKLLLSYRSWLYFQKNKHLKIALSPFAYFKNYKIVMKESDIFATPKNEFRFSAFAELQQQFFYNSHLTHRFFTEYRWFTTDNSTTLRFRYRLGFLFHLTQKIDFYPSEEVFFNLNKPQLFFDQNRLLAQVNIKLSKKQKLETGYMYCIKNQTVNNNDLVENNFFLNYTFIFGTVSK